MYYGMRRLVYHKYSVQLRKEVGCQFTLLPYLFQISDGPGSVVGSLQKEKSLTSPLAPRLKKNPEAAACNAVDLHCWYYNQSMSAATNSNESYCTFTLASDVTAGGLPSEEEIAKQLESNDPKVCLIFL